MVRYRVRARGFNPRPSVRGDTEGDWYKIIADGFNPRPSVRGDAKYSVGNGAGNHGFNPRPFVRGDVVLGNLPKCQNVSIHAPS